MFATEVISAKGKIVKRYKHEDVKTPLECLFLLNRDFPLEIFKGNKLV